MKKILLLSITSLAMLMADFTLIGEQLTPTVEETTPPTVSETPPPTSNTINSYLEPVDIPAYNANDSTHVLITTTNGKWTESVVNNLAYKHFYLTPGRYPNSAVTLRVSGTESSRRTISLYNPSKPTDDTHPAALTDGEQANAKIYFNGASYWTIDRISALENSVGTYDYLMSFLGQSHRNIINAAHHRGMLRGIIIYPGSHYNTIQKSYIHDAPHEGRVADNVGIFLYGSDGSPGLEILGTKIIDNDIKNLNDSIQLQRKHGSSNHIDFAGTIIDSNRLWVDNTVYSDGSGHYNPNGEYMIAENAFDVKDGSEDPNNPVIFTNNIAWGYRETDSVATGQSTAGKPINISFADCKNIRYESNIVFDSEWGMHLTHLKGTGSTIRDNILYDIGNVTPPTAIYPNGRDVWVLSTPSSSAISTIDLPVENNTIIDTGTNNIGAGRVIYVNTNSDGINIKNNLLIDTINTQGDKSNQDIDNTWSYNHTGIKLGGTNEHVLDEFSPEMGNYSFKYEKFTASPKNKTLVGVISTIDSPHYNKAGSSIAAAVDAPIQNN